MKKLTDPNNPYVGPGDYGRRVKFDTESMTVDLITIFKAGGYAESDLVSFVQKLWPQVQIDVSLPSAKKN